MFDDVRLEVERFQPGRLHHVNQSKVQGEVGPAGHLGQEPRQPRQAGPGVKIGRGAAVWGGHLINRREQNYQIEEMFIVA